MYKLKSNGIIRLLDNVNIPNDPKNRDWRKYQKWLAEGNKPEPEFTKTELAAKKISDIKMKESEIVQVQGQLNIAAEKGLSIVSDYEAQLAILESELADLKDS